MQIHIKLMITNNDTGNDECMKRYVEYLCDL